MVSRSELTQNEADYLIALEKQYLGSDPVDFPNLNEKISLELKSLDKRELFIFDITRGSVNIQKVTYQNRVRTVIILVRLDIDGPTHRNPDGQEISTSHLHVYREGFGDKWAYELNSDKYKKYFTKPVNIDDSVIDFMKFCNITKQPDFQRPIT